MSKVTSVQIDVTKIDKWRDVKGYEGRYKVSNNGVIKSYAQNNPKILSTQIDDLGYESVKLYIDGKYKRHKIHRLVAEAFVANPKKNPEVNHIDCDKSNNSVENLEWVTKSENMKHADTNGLLSDKKGYKNPASKFNKNDVLDILSLNSQGWFTQSELARAYQVHLTTIQRLIYRNQ